MGERVEQQLQHEHQLQHEQHWCANESSMAVPFALSWQGIGMQRCPVYICSDAKRKCSSWDRALSCLRAMVPVLCVFVALLGCSLHRSTMTSNAVTQCRPLQATVCEVHAETSQPGLQRRCGCAGFSARQRKLELERLNEQLRKINMNLRQQARAGTVYAPGLMYAPTPMPNVSIGSDSDEGSQGAAATLVVPGSRPEAPEDSQVNPNVLLLQHIMLVTAALFGFVQPQQPKLPLAFDGSRLCRVFQRCLLLQCMADFHCHSAQPPFCMA